MSAADSFFVKYRANVTGPHARDEIATMVKKGMLSPIHRVSVDQANWRPLHELDGWQYLWPTTAEATGRTPNALAEPPPLPTKTPPRPNADGRDEPLDVELL